MAFNQGPQPEIVFNANGVRYVDPNPTDEIVNHEDLVMYVKLVARSKGRSILTYDQDTETVTNISELRNVKSETNFTYQTGKDFLDTSWTNIGGGNLNFGEDLGSFGITNINIEFKSSFMPQIVIDFVDVRGAALFEQGPCSPYAVFFHLPYPVFELTVKGYYGRPVTYTLALVKFNTKFNSDTGNFESKAEFVGYTYAFLADIPMGYVMAAYYMERPHNGKDILAKKWAQLLEKKIIDESSFTDSKKPLSIYDLIKNAKKLEQRTSELKNLQEIKDLGKVTSTRSQLDGLKNSVLQLRKELADATAQSQNSGFEKSPSSGSNKDLFYLKLPNDSSSDSSEVLTKVKDAITKHLGDGSSVGGLIGTQLTTVQSYYTQNGLTDSPSITIEGIKAVTSGLLGKSYTVEENLRKYSIDIYESMLKPIETAYSKIAIEQTGRKDKVREKLNKEVITTLGFLPTVSNVFAIILTNVEVFLELLLLTSRDAENYHIEHDIKSGLGGGSNLNVLELRNKPIIGAQLSDLDSEQQRDKIYPWPTYYENKQPASATNTQNNTQNNSSEVGSKETYPGENSEFVSWPEVVFVENFIKALTRLKGELAVLELEKENLPGFDNFVPITPFETHAFGNNNAPSRWYKIQQATSEVFTAIYKIMGENAFILGDYTMINSLSVWKSQLGFKNGWGVESLTNYQGNTNGYTPATLGGFGIGPQRLKDNPEVDLTKLELNRYPSARYKGFTYQNNGEDGTKVESFQRKIVPTTRARMKKWGYVDALNLMTTLKLDGEGETIFSFLKTNITTEKKDEIKQKIKEALKDKLTTQTFDQWKVSATNEIGGDVKLVDQQSIWQYHFDYVKQKNVLSHKGEITLNENSQEGKAVKIHPNPYKNPNGGAILVKADEIASRQIDFSSQSIPDTVKQNYTKKYADVTEVDSTISESKLEADISSLAYTVLKYRPKPAVNPPLASYHPWTLSNNKNTVNLIRDKNTNMLSLGTYFYPNFFHTYEKSKDLSSGNIIFDISSSRRYLEATVASSSNSWLSFMGSPHYNSNYGSANSIINTPLWTLNYPFYKNAWNYADGGGDAGFIGLDEAMSVKDGKYVNDTGDIYPSMYNDVSTNQRRNWSTWWGLNQWGVDSDTDYYKPLAYIAVMSLGFFHPTVENRTGHFPPWDGDDDGQLSSFSNFTSTAIVANLPKSYVLLLGALLWRMKETGLLRWDKDSNGVGINPKRDQINTSNKGWNTYGSSVGIDDMNDPVWFFHTSTSKPRYAGGSVYAIPNGTNGWNIEANGSSVYGQYERRFVTGTNNGDRWTNGGGSITSGLALDRPVLIGNNDNLSSTNYYDSSKAQGWTKGHTIRDGAQFNDSNNSRGFYDMVRADQLPFLKGFDGDYSTPRTLVITSLDSTENIKMQYNGGVTTNPTPTLTDNSTQYPVLKEKCKELLFLPRDLKIDFITAFEDWATGETGKWLATMDPLNWTDDGKLDNYATTQNAAVGDDYRRSGYRGFLKFDTYYNKFGFNKWITEIGTNRYRQRFDYIDSGEIGQSAPTPPASNNNPTSNQSTIVDTKAQSDGNQCFVAGTKIKLANGNLINIEDLTLNDKLLTYNLDTKEFETSEIGGIRVDYRENIITYHFENGNKITCTESHPIWVVNKGWSSFRENNFDDEGHFVKVKQILIGDECLYYSDDNFKKSKITKITQKSNRPVRVWNIMNVSGNKNFIVNGILAHNVS